MDGVATHPPQTDPPHGTESHVVLEPSTAPDSADGAELDQPTIADDSAQSQRVSRAPRIIRFTTDRFGDAHPEPGPQDHELPDEASPDLADTTTSADDDPSADTSPPQAWQRRRPIILGQVVPVPATTDWRRVATIAGVLAFFVWILTGFLARSDDTQRIAKRLEEASREVAKQEAKVEVLRKQVAYLATDAYVEVAAREKLGLVKPGDHPVIVLPEIDEVAWVPPAPPERPSGPFGPRYGRLDDWFRMFFGGADEGILGKS